MSARVRTPFLEDDSRTKSRGFSDQTGKFRALGVNVPSVEHGAKRKEVDLVTAEKSRRPAGRAFIVCKCI